MGSLAFFGLSAVDWPAVVVVAAVAGAAAAAVAVAEIDSSDGGFPCLKVNPHVEAKLQLAAVMLFLAAAEDVAAVTAVAIAVVAAAAVATDVAAEGAAAGSCNDLFRVST